MIKDGLRLRLSIINRVLIPPSWVLRNAGVIIAFHSNSIRQHPSLEGLGVCNSSPQRIMKLINDLKRHYKILSFEEFVDCAEARKSLRGTALITFDDGFKSVYQDLYAPLKETCTPFIVFLNSSVCENKKLLWMQKLTLILQRRRFHELLDGLRARGWPGYDRVVKLAAPSFLDVRFAFMHFFDRRLYEEVFDLFLRDLGISEEAEAREADLFLSRDELWEMRDLCTPGNHTHSHSNVANLTYEELDEELARCNDFIREIGWNGIIPFCVPFGPKYYLTSRVREVVQKHCPFIFTAYGYGNLNGRQTQFRRFNGDDLRINGFDDMKRSVTGIDDVRHYLYEWITIAAGR